MAFVACSHLGECLCSGLPSLTQTSGYQIPLPRGGFKVVFYLPAADSGTARGFGVTIEGEVISVDHETGSWSNKQRLEVAVVDGLLDLDFIRGVGDPVIAALEICKLRE